MIILPKLNLQKYHIIRHIYYLIMILPQLKCVRTAIRADFWSTVTTQATMLCR
jgi:hypothetical protein